MERLQAVLKTRTVIYVIGICCIFEVGILVFEKIRRYRKDNEGEEPLGEIASEMLVENEEEETEKAEKSLEPTPQTKKTKERVQKFVKKVSFSAFAEFKTPSGIKTKGSTRILDQKPKRLFKSPPPKQTKEDNED